MKLQFSGIIYIFFIIFLVLIIAFISNILLINVIPTFTNPVNNNLGSQLYNGLFKFFDASFFFIFIFLMILYIFIAYSKPNVAMGIINIILLFSLAISSLLFRIGIINMQNIFNWSNLLPQTYAFFINGYYLIVLFFTIIMVIIFNFRSPNSESL